ncbi:hypothetical protein Tco_0174229 [Tanacetum coccineum]
MSPRMRTQSAGRPAAESLKGGTGVQGLRAIGGVKGVNRNVKGVNRGVGGAPDFSMIVAQQLQNLLPAMLAQVGNQGNVENQNGNAVNKNVQENVRNVLVNGNRVGCLYKEFLACNPKEYDGNGGVVVLTRWIKKMENVQDMSGCSVGQKVKYTAGSFVKEFCLSHEMQKLETKLWNHAMVGAGHAAYTDRFHELASNRAKDYTKGCANFWCTDRLKALDGSIKKVEEKREMWEKPSKDNNGVDPIELGFRYEIEIASGQLVEIDKVIKGCKLEIEGHVFDIDLIPFRHGSFDVIIGEKLEEKMRHLKSAKAKEREQKEIEVVRDFPEVFPDGLSRLPPVQEIEFSISLNPWSNAVAKSAL